jgi:hypothetical protein
MKQIILPVISVLIWVGGCSLDKQTAVPQTLSNVSVRTSCDPAAKFPAGSKYAFVQFAEEEVQEPEVVLIEKRIEMAVSGELKKKGYKPGEYNEISFFVVYSLTLQHEIDVLVGKSKVQGNEWISAIVVPNDYVSGALLVQILNPKTMEPIWLGVFNADIVIASVSEREKQERVDYAVRELLRQFPPQ